MRKLSKRVLALLPKDQDTNYNNKCVTSTSQNIILTRLTYNCAHLRLNNKKNMNELSQNDPRDFFGEKFFGVKIFCVKIFWGENCLVENFFGCKLFN